MSYMVFTARRRLDDLAGAVYETVFYDAMNAILDKGLWRSYVHDVTGKTLTFESMDEFLTSEDGLGIKNLGLFGRCMDAVSRSPGATATLASNLLSRLEKERGMSNWPNDIAELASHGEIGNGRQSRVDIINSTQGGTSQSYLLQRLKRDRPDLIEQLEAGMIKSVRAAAINAGIVKDVPSVPMNEPAKAAAAILRRTGKDFATQLAIELAGLTADA